jgi:hypothetical protein
MKISIFWDVASSLAYSSTLKMETCSSEALIEFQRTIRCYISEDIIIRYFCQSEKEEEEEKEKRYWNISGKWMLSPSCKIIVQTEDDKSMKG